MKKCVVTNEETTGITNNVPLSREGRNLLNNIVESHNQQIADLFVQRAKDSALNNEAFNEEFIRSLAPKINKKIALRLLFKQESDIINTKNKVLESEA